jgi:hypothetical protein
MGWIKDIMMMNGSTHIQTIIEAHRKVYEKIILHQLSESEYPLPNVDMYNTFDEFKVYIQSDPMCIIGLLTASGRAFEVIIDMAQGMYIYPPLTPHPISTAEIPHTPNSVMLFLFEI